MKKRILAVLLAGIMIFGILAACNQEDPPPPPVATPTPTVAPTTAPPPPTPDPAVPDFRGEAGIGWNPLDYGGMFEPFANEVHITIGTFDRNRDDAPPIPDNYWTNWVQEYFGDNLNIKVEYVPIDRGATMAAYNRLFAAGQIPTILMEYDFDKVTEWWAEGALAEIDRQEFLNIAPTWVETSGGLDGWDNFMFDGGTYLAPALRPFWDTNFTWVTFYRLDWYEELNLGRPTSYAEWLDAQVKFKEHFNLPYTLDVGPFTNNFQFYALNDFPLNERDWAIYSCVSVPSLPAVGAKRALERMNEQFHLGLINPEFELDVSGGAGTQTDALAAFINGNLYRHSFFPQGSSPDLTAFYENNPNAKLGIMWNNTVNHPDVGGGSTHPQERATNPAGFFLGFGASASPEQIQAAYMYLEWMAQPDVLDYFQWGIEGINHEVVNGDRVMLPLDQQGDHLMGFSSNKDYWAVVVEIRVTDEPLQTAINIVPNNLPESARLREEQADRYKYLRARADAGLTYNDPLIGQAIPALGEYRDSLAAEFAVLATQLVKASPDEFDAMYTAAVATYRAAGYAQIEQQRGAAFDAGKVSRLNPIARGDQPFVWPPLGSVTSNVYR